MEKIKLVVWDLDETFWKGTLSEGDVEIIPQNVEIVKELTRRGIINSISSKNDFFTVKEKLEETDVWEYFVFPSIGWTAKGQNVKRLIEECQLRAPNVLFIDDNVGNRKEVEHYCSDINTADESIIPKLLDMVELKGKDDSKLSRLKQYKILEAKAEVKASYNDNVSFLRDSQIKVAFINDCKQYKDRILELINRTNQLNYTKVRLSEQELENVLNDESLENVCLHVKDKFGDYGICGFYSFDEENHQLKHFLFSCRILNLAFPAFVYQKLGKPEIQVAEPVAEGLEKDGIDWINEVSLKDLNKEEKVANGKKNKKRILLLGGCDLEQMCHYIDTSRFDVIKEFNYPSPNGFPVHREHTVYLRELENLTNNDIVDIAKLPFGDARMFESIIFSNNYNVLVYSVLMNYTHEVYENKNKGFKIAYGGYLNQAELCDYLKFNNTDRDGFFRDYIYLGQQSPEDFKNDLQWLSRKINKPIIVINGAETPNVCASEPESTSRHIVMNQALQEVAEHEKNIILLDVRKFIRGKEDHKDNIRHYQRPVYVKMAEELMFLLEGREIKVSWLKVLKERMKYLLSRIMQKIK